MTSYLDRPLAEYVADAAAKKASPGGGSVAALVGALATTMSSMAANFTVGKEKYRDFETQLQTDLKLLEEARRKFLDLMHRDMEAYEGVREAHRLPKATEAEIAAREAAIQEALGRSLLVPLKASKVAVEVLETTQELANIANVNLLSDVAVAAILAEAAYQALAVNVEENLRGCADAKMAEATRRDVADAGRLAARIKEMCLETVAARTRA